MNFSSKLLIRGTLFAVLIAVLTGCLVIKIHNSNPNKVAIDGYGPGPGQGHSPPPESGPEDPWPPKGSYTEIFDPIIVGDPIGNGGSIIIPATSFYNGNGNQSCFPNPPWNKYFPLPRFFLGPGVTPDGLSYTNIDQLPSVTVRTCESDNGTTLETGIVIYEQFNPNTDKKCVTNSPACLASTKLTINQRAIENNKKYRATVFYKSGTLSPLTSVKVTWSYP